MAERIPMLDTLENKGFLYHTDLTRHSGITPVESGCCPINPVVCIVFLEPCRLSIKLFCTDVTSIIRIPEGT